jgi:hypothetical protein
MAIPDKFDFEITIIAACNKHQQEHCEDKDYRACLSINDFIKFKFGDYETPWPEIHAHACCRLRRISRIYVKVANSERFVLLREEERGGVSGNREDQTQPLTPGGC